MATFNGIVPNGRAARFPAAGLRIAAVLGNPQDHKERHTLAVPVVFVPRAWLDTMHYAPRSNNQHHGASYYTTKDLEFPHAIVSDSPLVQDSSLIIRITLLNIIA